MPPLPISHQLVFSPNLTSLVKNLLKPPSCFEKYSFMYIHFVKQRVGLLMEKINSTHTIR